MDAIANLFHTFGIKIVATLSGVAMLFSGALSHAIVTLPPQSQAAASGAAVADPRPASSLQKSMPREQESPGVGTTTVINNYITRPVIERTVQAIFPVNGEYISKSDLATQLADLRTDIGKTVYGTTYPTAATSYGSGGLLNLISLNAKTENQTFTNVTFNGVTGLTDADVPDNVTASNYLPLLGGTLSGALTITSTATSTSGGGLNITGGCFAVSGTCITTSGGGGGLSFDYLFPSNATSTRLTFSGGLLSLASSTIGNGNQNGGLTISGGATTTGNSTVQGTMFGGELHLIGNTGPFAAKVDYPTGTSPFGDAVGDVNSDGKPDIVTANFTSAPGSISVLINNGDGTFATKVDYATTDGLVRDVAIGDVNGDGKADIVASHAEGSAVSVFINNGDGTFAAEVTYSTFTTTTGIALGDVNTDGKADIVVVGGGSLLVLMNNGDGTFASPSFYSVGLSAGPVGVALADLNGDNKLDVAVADVSSGAVSVLINNGDGTFATHVDYTTGLGSIGVVAADLNNDGHIDLASVNQNSTNKMSVLINNGDGTFATRVDYTTGADPQDIAAGDFNADGKVDLVIVNSSGNNASLYTNNGNGTFASRVNYTTGGFPTDVAVGDLNGDGAPDFVTADNSLNRVSVFLSTITPILFSKVSTGNVGIGTSTPAAASALDVFGNVFLDGPSRYLSFGSLYAPGVSGYGIRDNGGMLEFKNAYASTTALVSSWTPLSFIPNVRYTLTESAWTTATPTLPASLGASQAAVIGGYIYLFGGITGSSVYTNVIYRAPVSDPTNWTDTGSTLPSNLAVSQLATIGDYVYLFGGFNGTAYTNAIYRAPISDPTNWSDTGSTLPGTLGNSELAIVGDYVYLFGGFNGSWKQVIYRAALSNPTSWVDTGATLPPILGIGLSQAAVIGDYVYLFGGTNVSGPNRTILRAPVSDPTSWSDTGATIPSILSNSQLAIIGDYVYLFGGNTGSATNAVYRAPISNPTSWVTTASVLPSNLTSSHAVVVGDNIYLFGGHNGSAYSNAIYRAPITSNQSLNKNWLQRQNPSAPSWIFGNATDINFMGGKVGIGTTTPFAMLQSATTTGRNLVLTDTNAGANLKHWLFSSRGGNLYIGTTSDAFATSTIAAFTLSATGFGTTTLRGLTISGQATSTSNVGLNLSGGCFAVSGTCLQSSTFGFPWTPTTSFGITANSTSTLLLMTGGLSASSTIRFGNNGGSGFIFNSTTGNAGLGTTTPFAGLQIVTTTGKNLVLTDSGAGTNLKHWLFSSRGGNLYVGTTTDAFATSTPPALTILNSGNAGFGTTTPWRTLSASGTVGFQGLTGSAGSGSLCLSTSNEVVFNSGTDSCLSSLRTTKHDITPLSLDALSQIAALQPVSFIYNNDLSSTTRYGFIAEDAATIDSHLGTYDAEGKLSGVDDRGFLAIIVSALHMVMKTVGGFAQEFVSDKLVARNELCIGETCVTESQLKALLHSQNIPLIQQVQSSAAAFQGAIDTEPPMISLNGGDSVRLDIGATYTDLGARVTDNIDTDLGYKTLVGSTPLELAGIETNEPATYHIFYVATDKAGNTATSTRTVTVGARDSEEPVAGGGGAQTLNGASGAANTVPATPTKPEVPLNPEEPALESAE